MYVRGKFVPPDFMLPKEILNRSSAFQNAITPLFEKQRGQNNLLPHPKRALYCLQHNNDFVIMKCDKNLGPAILEKSVYVQRAMDGHLSDQNTYKFLTPTQALHYKSKIMKIICKWICKYHKDITKMER
eukprot:6838990-Ditylum_brightwellii.AAC.1